MEKMPGKLQAIVIIHLVTGIIGAATWALLILIFCGAPLFAITPLYCLVVYVMAIISGAKGLGQQPRHTMYKTIGIMQIITILGADVLSLASGILTLVFLEDPEVKAYLAGGAYTPPAPPAAPAPPAPPAPPAQ